MATIVRKQSKSKTKLSKEEKQFFEKTKDILPGQGQLILSERDCEVFFNAIFNPREPNEHLREAAKRYYELFPE